MAGLRRRAQAPAIGRRRPGAGGVRRLELAVGGLLGPLPGDPHPQTFARLLAAVGACVQRYDAPSRILVTCAPLAGHAPNGVPVLVDVRPDQPFGELVEQVLADLAEAYADQDASFPATPADERLAAVACRMARVHGDLPDLRWAVSVTLDRQGDALTGMVELDAAAFGEDEGRWFRDHLEHALRTACADAAERTAGEVAAASHHILTVGEVAALPPASHRMVTVEWSGARVPPVSTAECLHRLVEAQVDKAGDALAVIHPDGALSYADLNTRANRLARYLVDEQLVRAGDLVGIAMERSLDLAVAVLAVLKAGAAYVPLDPTHPESRLRHILSDTRAQLVLTHSDFAERLPATDATIISVDEHDWRVAATSGENLDTPDVPQSTACVIYTSGTTGRPKGVMLTHRGLCNSMRWEHAAYQITPRDRLLHLASFTFSLAIVELFSPLCAGAQVVIAPPRAARDSRWIARLVAEHGVTLLSVVPSELKLLLEQEPSMPWSSLKAVITGADVLPVPLQDLYLATCPDVPLFNIYGQTESSVDGTFWICGPLQDERAVPVGRPITNTRMYILDEAMRPVPPGVVGEIFTGGVALAHGYVARPDLTAARFVPNPFAESPADSRLYRSGDLACWLPGGVIQLAGRNDHQVQVRGIRVELEEIEAVLREHPGISDVVVTAQTDPPPDVDSLISAVPESVLADMVEEVERLGPRGPAQAATAHLDTIPRLS
ncbi:amino acid adenylation domain-containing protein [Nonomuraea sp. NPDC049400]|uniref:amino acid adenylation domain-containing protein n=1 Tax=Nonomuraea sp. NPDC049400 TaxID=3364352 RepID=UPI00379ACE95